MGCHCYSGGGGYPLAADPVPMSWPSGVMEEGVVTDVDITRVEELLPVLQQLADASR